MTEPAAMPDDADLRAANVNPMTGLATDYLNLFNEYVMLAELAETGALPHDSLCDWAPRPYGDHFAAAGFAGTEVVLAAYAALGDAARQDFESAVADLTVLILSHQRGDGTDLGPIRAARDHVATLISGAAGPGGGDTHADLQQAAIDALFD